MIDSMSLWHHGEGIEDEHDDGCDGHQETLMLSHSTPRHITALLIALNTMKFQSQLAYSRSSPMTTSLSICMILVSTRLESEP